MWWLAVKAIISGLIVAAASEIARRNSGLGALIVSLPLVSVLSMIWLWQDRPDAEAMASFNLSTFYFFLPSMPMFIAIPWLLRAGVNFYVALLLGCILTFVLYALTAAIGPRFGVRL